MTTVIIGVVLACGGTLGIVLVVYFKNRKDSRPVKPRWTEAIVLNRLSCYLISRSAG